MDAAGARILIVDDDAASRRLLDMRLRALGYDTIMAPDGQDALATLRDEPPALMLLDLQMSRMGGREVLRALRRDALDLPVIVITAHGSIEAAAEAMREGECDFLPKSFDPHHLEIVVRKALERRRLVRVNRLLQDSLDARTPQILGDSPAIRQAIAVTRNAAAAVSTVLRLGESGIGKEVFAHAIHPWSERREMPLVIVNCLALSEHLLEGELFGHERGACTGPIRRRQPEILGRQRTHRVRLLRALEIRGLGSAARWIRLAPPPESRRIQSVVSRMTSPRSFNVPV